MKSIIFKKRVMIVALFAALFAGCSDDKTTPSIEVPGGLTINVASTAESKIITFNATAAWTATASETWITLTPTSGIAGTTNLIADIKANTGAARTATVTIASGSVKKEVTVSQSADNSGGGGSSSDVGKITAKVENGAAYNSTIKKVVAFGVINAYEVEMTFGVYSNGGFTMTLPTPRADFLSSIDEWFDRIEESLDIDLEVSSTGRQKVGYSFWSIQQQRQSC